MPLGFPLEEGYQGCPDKEYDRRVNRSHYGPSNALAAGIMAEKLRLVNMPNMIIPSASIIIGSNIEGGASSVGCRGSVRVGEASASRQGRANKFASTR